MQRPANSRASFTARIFLNADWADQADYGGSDPGTFLGSCLFRVVSVFRGLFFVLLSGFVG